MRHFIIVLFCIVTRLIVFGQEPDAGTLHETAKKFMRSGDWSNAILVLNKALAKDPGNISIKKDLALTKYYQRDFAGAREQVVELLENAEADVQAYQIAGNVYKALDELKDCERMYRKGLKTFPESGALYAEFGELLWMQQNPDCINQWLTGIEKDPGYAANYYHAAKVRYAQGAMVWAILYGEIFINIESYSRRTAETKTMLFEAYKQYFSGANVKNNTKQSPFIEEVSKILNKHQSVITSGITTESLIMLRSRFILDWQKTSAEKYPYRLFDHHLQLLQEGLFEAYSYWIFEAASDLNNYERWMKQNPNPYKNFTRFQQSKLFKIPPGQHYIK